MTHPRAETLKAALENVKAAILEANIAVITDTLWMPERLSKNETVVDYIDAALSTVPEGEVKAWRWHWLTGSDRDREWSMWTYSETPAADLTNKVVEPLYTTPQPAPSFAEGVEAAVTSAVDSPTVAALAQIFSPRNNLHLKPLSQQVVELLTPRLLASLSPAPSQERVDELTPEQISIVNDMICAWIGEDERAQYREAFRSDCKRLLKTVAPSRPSANAEAVRLREALTAAREAVVLAVAFLGRDMDSDRLKQTAHSLTEVLVKADQAALLALSPQADPADDAAVAWHSPSDSAQPFVRPHIKAAMLPEAAARYSIPLYTHPAKAVDVETIARSLKAQAFTSRDGTVIHYETMAVVKHILTLLTTGNASSETEGGQPADRREVVAQALARKWPGDYALGDDETSAPNALALETTDAILSALDGGR
jgi:hypothetical protein